MNEAHLHLLVNHFPIIGLFFGFFILLFGTIKNVAILKKTAYIIFIFCMIMGKISMITGDKAEHFVEKLDSFSHDIIHNHEEAAELFMKLLYILGLLSIFGLVTIKKEMKSQKIVAFCLLFVCGFCLFLSKNVGTSGGEISHPEIRSRK